MVFKFSKYKSPSIQDGFVKVDYVCPGCGNHVIFESKKGCSDLYYHDGLCDQYYFGQRICPDPECKTHIFFIKTINSGGPTHTKIFPSEIRLKNLDISKLPQNIKFSLEEALKCFNNLCFRASAIMIRRTLEEICELQQAKGNNLHQRIEDLKTKITISEQLYEALMELKFLGNDAAHIESKHFEQIGEIEVEAALVLLTEILRALYEHQNLLDKFKALKKS